MKNNKILIIGASGHAKVIIDIIEKEGKFEIFGLIDSFKEKGEKVLNYTILGTEEDIPLLTKTNTIFGGIIAIGDNWARKSIFKKISSFSINFKFITAIHPNAIIGKNVIINGGTVIMAGSVINSNAIIGKQCIINTKSSIGHDTIIKKFCSIAPGVTIGGEVFINKCSAISLGSNIIESIKVGKHSIIGAGSLVNKNIGDYKVAYGLPAKEVRNRKKNDKYLGMKNTEKSFSYSLELSKISNKQDEKSYTSVLEEFPEYNIFYSLDYFNYSGDKDLRYFILRKNNEVNVLMPVYFNKINIPNDSKNIPFYDVSSPYGYSGPLLNNATDKDLKTFWSKVDNWYKKNNVITEFIRFNLEKNHSQYSGHLIPSLNNIIGEISDFETLWGNFKQKVRNNYRRAEKSLLSCEIYPDVISEDILNSFYHIYIKTMERNTATKNYFYPISYFKDLIKHNPDKVLIVIVYKDNIPISSEFIINSKNTLYSYLGGTLSEYFETRPNDFLKIEVMKWAIKNNKKKYVLGGGRTNFDGLYQYKKSFFPKDEDAVFYTGRKILNEKIYFDLLKEIEVEYTNANSLILNSNKYFPIYKEINNNFKNNKLSVITSKAEWQDVLKQVENYDFYHTYDYHNLSKEKDEKAILIKYTEGDILIALPLIIRKIDNSNYFDATSVYGYAGPLQINLKNTFDNSNFIKAIDNFFNEEKIISVFSRLNPFLNNQQVILDKLGIVENLGDVVNIDITKDLDLQRTQYSKSTKSRVNKARKQCYVKQVSSETEINEFIDIYYENMERLGAKDSYFFDRKYFFDFYNSTDFKTIILTVFDIETDKAIAASMFVITNGIIQFHLSGTKNDALNIAPARLFLDEMRLIGTKEGCQVFNLGGGLGGEQDSLFDFKASFSKDYRAFNVWKYIVNQEIYNELSNKIELTENIDFFPLYRYKQ